MHVVGTKPRFAWDCLEDRPRLKTVRHFFAALRSALSGRGDLD